MRVFISADIEGITGLVSWSQCNGPNPAGGDWAFARAMMAHDVNAAIRGAKSAGATYVVVKDSHGSGKNLLVRDLEPDVELISGTGCGNLDGMMEGVDGSFDAAFLVGYHARAGTSKGVMSHTISGKVHRLRINGVEVGEIGLSAGTAGRYGVPLVMVSSDAAGCAEAEALIPGLRTAVVKTGMGRYMGQVSATDVTGPLIESAAADALCTMGSIRPWVPESPMHIAMEFNREEEADYCERLFGVTRTDGYSLEATCQDYAETHRLIRLMITMAGLGSGAGD